MKVTYYALKPIQVLDDVRQPGDLIPEAAEWPFIDGHVREGRLAPVLVACLPRRVQDELQRWEDDQRAHQDDPHPEPEPVPDPPLPPQEAPEVETEKVVS